MEDRALLIEWIQHTGKRAGNVDPRDPQLQCYGWQNMDVEPAIELRVVEDNRDLSQYEGVKGVTILIGKEQINIAIDEYFPVKYSIEDNLLYEEHVKQEIGNSHIIINDLPENRNDRMKRLKTMHHIKGIREVHPIKV